MDISHLINAFDVESKQLDRELRRHPLLSPIFSRNFAGVRLDELKDAYLRFSKVSADYVFHTVPMFSAARAVLMEGDAEDRAWGELFHEYAAGETDEKEDYGHHIWGLNDMKALGAPKEMLEAPPCEAVNTYARFFIEEVRRHPYAVLGAKGVLEHLSLRMADDVAAGLIASGIPNAENAVTLFHHHGVLDIDHVREGDKNLAKLVSPSKRVQVLEGAYFTSGSYRMFLHMALPT